MKKTLIFTAIFVLTAVNGFCQKGIAFDTTSTWSKLLEISLNQKRLIFIDCYTSWCGPCKGMAKEVFPDIAVGEFMNNHFICTKRDMEKGEGIILNKKYKKFIPGYPTYLLINSNEDVVFQVSGFMKPELFIAKMKEGLENRSWIAMSAQYKDKMNDWSFVREYASLLDAAYQKNLLDSVKKDVLSKMTFNYVSKDSNAFLLFRKYWTDAEAPLFIEVLKANFARQYKVSERDMQEWSGKIFNNKVKDYYKALIKSRQEYNISKAEAFLLNLRNFSFPGREDMIVCMLMYNAAYKSDMVQYSDILEHAKEYGLLKYKTSDINNTVRYCFDKPKDKKTLDLCLKYTQVPANDKFASMDEYRNHAYFLELAGDKANAAICLQKADSIEKEFKEKFGNLMK